VYAGLTLEAQRTGLAAPAGIAFSPGRRTFYVVGGRGEGDASATDVVELTPFAHAASGDRAGSVRIAAALDDPIDLAFDAARGRLLFVDRSLHVVRGEEIVVRQLGHIALTFDHRVVDGSRAAEFGLAVIARLEPGEA
jgi:hypothetical protein